MKILILEDSPAIVGMIQAQVEDYSLAGQKTEVVDFDNVKDALNWCVKNKDDQTWFMVDGELEGKETGVEFLRWLNAEEKKRAIFMGGYPSVRHEATELGVSLGINKSKVVARLIELMKGETK